MSPFTPQMELSGDPDLCPEGRRGAAYQLYEAAAGMTEDPKLQKTLLTFAEVELGHRRRLRRSTMKGTD
jgi:hypothetical protein